MSNILPRWSLSHCHITDKCIIIFLSWTLYHLIPITYRSLLSLNSRNVAALAFKLPLILIPVLKEMRWEASFISAPRPSLWKINEHAEHVNGKQTFGVIKAVVVTCECGEVGRWEAALSARPLERCPQLSGLVSVVVCLFVFLCGDAHTLLHTHRSDMKRLLDILQFTLYSDLGLMSQLRLIHVSIIINLICSGWFAAAVVEWGCIFVFEWVMSWKMAGCVVYIE